MAAGIETKPDWLRATGKIVSVVAQQFPWVRTKEEATCKAGPT